MRRTLAVLLLAAVSAAAGPKAKKPNLPGLPGQPDARAKAVEGVVRQYVRDQVEEEGSFSVEDEVLGRAWEADLISVRWADLRDLGEDKVSVCADFKGGDAKNSQPLDIDFVLSKGDDEWVVDEIHLHRVAKTYRFTYDKKNRRVPVKAGKGGKRPAVPAGEPGE